MEQIALNLPKKPVKVFIRAKASQSLNNRSGTDPAIYSREAGEVRSLQGVVGAIITEYRRHFDEDICT